ncbi:MAG: hypothetical protein OEN55_01200 [Alphaproteobacteria bacterium]|nr:hypothetical protein [Alphaproteobacteria bacterium]
MNMKAAASLTGSLLARKGAAYPAAYSAPSAAPSATPADSDDKTQPQRAYNDPRVIASAPPQPAAPSTQDPQLQDGRLVSDSSPHSVEPEAGDAAPLPLGASEEGLSIPQVMDKMGRVRLSVRLDPDRYLRVKMASARTRWSAQDIVIAALDRYLGGSASGNSTTSASDADDADDADDEDSVN